MSRNYLIRRLMLAIPSLLAISIILYTILALAPGDPLGELATNPNVPPLSAIIPVPEVLKVPPR